MRKLFLVLIMLAAMNASGQWVRMENGINYDRTIYSMCASGSNIFAGTVSHGVFLSTNYGVSWNQTSLNNQYISYLIVRNNTIYAGSSNGVFISTNNGSSWTQTGAYMQNILSLAADGNNIYAGTNYDGVYKSTNNGINWIQTTLNNQAIWSLLITGNNIFAGTNGFGVYLSTNNSTSWTNTGLNNKSIISFAIIGTNIFAGTAYFGVYHTSNNGISWVQTSLTKKVVYSLTAFGNNLFAGIQDSPTDSGGVYHSTNNGLSWIQINQGFNSILTVYSLLIVNDYAFAGTRNKSVWRRPLSEIIGIQNISTEIPSAYSLGQNYPNPFNPVTKIRFEVQKLESRSQNSEVTLRIFDVLGREVETLVNERLQAGTYETSFDGSGLNSGVYFYRFKTDGYSETKRMVLIK